MRSLLFVIVLALTAAYGLNAAVSLDATDMPAKDAFDSIARQSGAQILLDSDVAGPVNAALKDRTTDEAVDAVAKAVGANWRKVQFATASDTTVTLEKVKAAVSALAALNVPGLSITDPTSGKVSVFAKGLGQDAVSNVKLPEGQTWKTYYLVSKPGAKAQASKSPAAAGGDPLASQRLNKLASMNSEERQQYVQSEFASEQQLAPEARVQLWRDRMSALRALMQDPTMRDQLRTDFREAFRGMRPEGERGRRQDRNREQPAP
ncbi:MAG: hypothetical protein Q7T82_09900 [Armatimonadota bacterium]|nr:hypothetical protein [Armatimonadota bacterium]